MIWIDFTPIPHRGTVGLFHPDISPHIRSKLPVLRTDKLLQLDIDKCRVQGVDPAYVLCHELDHTKMIAEWLQSTDTVAHYYCELHAVIATLRRFPDPQGDGQWYVDMIARQYNLPRFEILPIHLQLSDDRLYEVFCENLGLDNGENSE